MSTQDLYDKVCNGRFCKLEDKIDSLDKKFDNKIDKLSDTINDNHIAILDRIEPLTNFKYKVLGAVSVVVIVISVAVSYSIANMKTTSKVNHSISAKQETSL